MARDKNESGTWLLTLRGCKMLPSRLGNESIEGYFFQMLLMTQRRLCLSEWLTWIQWVTVPSLFLWCSMMHWSNWVFSIIQSIHSFRRDNDSDGDSFLPLMSSMGAAMSAASPVMCCEVRTPPTSWLSFLQR